MESFDTIDPMNRRLTDEQIQRACEQLLQTHRQPTTRQVMQHLQEHHGASGRSARIGKILRATLSLPVIRTDTPLAAENTLLKEALTRAIARADLSEARERSHQDFYANQYALKAAEFESRLSALDATPRGVSPEQYLRLYQRAAELLRRLSQYEPVEPLLPPPG